MAPALVPRLALGILFTGANGFTPFAGVEELKPQRLRDFCGEAGEAGLRWCKHSFSKRLEDGGEVEMSWRMRANPDNILSLDTEAEHGVRLLRCSPEELELQLPDSHMGHVQPGKFIVGSRFVHGCGHIEEKHLYHRVVKVIGRKSGPGNAQRVRMVTEELPSFAHAVPNMHFYFSYMPVEATDLVPHPEMRTDYGLNREYLDRRTDRKLMSLNPFKLAEKLKNLDGVDTDDGGFHAGGKSGGTISTQNGILNFVPKQVSNFGWNWDFFMNATQEPNYTINIPGAKGIVRVRKPYVKVHAGIFLNFTSEFGGLSVVPKVNWLFGMKGHGYVQGRVLAVLNTTNDASVDANNKFDLPLLKKFHEPQWFQKIEFATGHMPISIEPGFQFNANLYHTGTFHGGVAFGGKTHGYLTPMLAFDSKKGFEVHWNGTLYDTEIIPPLWMIFTKRFEMGLLLKPLLLMRGDFAGLEKATMAIEFRPYVNLTITRDGDNASSGPTDETRTLTVYPFRVMGITDVQFQRKYKVRVEALGQAIETSPEMNWGQVSFHDHVSNFSVGKTTQQSVIAQVVTVTLYEVDDSSSVPTEKALGTGQVQCTSLLNGECHPSPPVAHIMQGTLEVAAVELAIIWQDSPEPWFASKIRGVGVSFPQVALRQDAVQSNFPSVQQGQGVTMHLIKDGLTYTMPIQGDVSTAGGALNGDTVIEFGPGFLETWMPCSAAAGAKCQSPRLELYYGKQQVAVANLPQIEWTSQTAMQGTQNSFASGSTMNVPCSVVLYAPGSTTSSIAVVTMNAAVVNPASASFVMEPFSAQKVSLTTLQNVAWTVSSVVRSQEYSFTLTPMKLVAVLPSQMENYVTFRKVGNQVLAPIVNTSETFSMKCSAIAIGGMSASEAPCSFSHSVPIGVCFSVGDQAVVQIQWSDDGGTHQMFSPPFVIVPKASARLLSPREKEPERRLNAAAFKKKWDNRVAQHQKSCDTKNLHIDLGAGVMFRGRVDNVGVPKGFPMLGGLDEKPTLTTGFHKIAAIKPGTNVEDLLPAALCKGGLCSGALPGCTNASNIKVLSYPKLHFNMSRPYYYSMRKKKGKFNGLFQKVLAYAFSTLPEVVDVLTKEVNQSQTSPPPAAAPAPAPTTAAPGSIWGSNKVQGTPFPTTAPTPTPSPAGQGPEEVGSAFNKWWSGAARRLSSASVHKEPERERVDFQSVAENQVIVTFREGLHYKLDRPLVERMIQNGYFMDIEDDATEELGPLRITSLYRIDDGVEPGDISEESVNKAAFPLHVQVLTLLFAATGSCLAAAAFLAKRLDRRSITAAFNWLASKGSAGYSTPAPCAEEVRGLE